MNPIVRLSKWNHDNGTSTQSLSGRRGHERVIKSARLRSAQRLTRLLAKVHRPVARNREANRTTIGGWVTHAARVHVLAHLAHILGRYGIS